MRSLALRACIGLQVPTVIDAPILRDQRLFALFIISQPHKAMKTSTLKYCTGVICAQYFNTRLWYWLYWNWIEWGIMMG